MASDRDSDQMDLTQCADSARTSPDNTVFIKGDNKEIDNPLASDNTVVWQNEMRLAPGPGAISKNLESARVPKSTGYWSRENDSLFSPVNEHSNEEIKPAPRTSTAMRSSEVENAKSMSEQIGYLWSNIELINHKFDKIDTKLDVSALERNVSMAVTQALVPVLKTGVTSAVADAMAPVIEMSQNQNLAMQEQMNASLSQQKSELLQLIKNKSVREEQTSHEVKLSNMHDNEKSHVEQRRGVSKRKECALSPPPRPYALKRQSAFYQPHSHRENELLAPEQKVPASVYAQPGERNVMFAPPNTPTSERSELYRS
ncbi:unnamed protein product, partial [Owenia fusiformis]